MPDLPEEAVEAALTQFGAKIWGLEWRLLDSAPEKVTHEREEQARAELRSALGDAAPIIRHQRDEELRERLGMSEADVVGIALENYAVALGLVRDLLADAERIYEPGFEDPPHVAAAKNLGDHEEALRLLGLLDSIFEEADDA